MSKTQPHAGQPIVRRGQSDWTDIFLRWDWIVKQLTIEALLPGLTPEQIKELKRRERKAREGRRHSLDKAKAEIIAKLAEWEAHPMSQTTPHFLVGQRVLCIDASPNRRCAVIPLKRGGIYVIRAIDQKPGWQAPGWGVHLEGIWVVHPDLGCEWPMKPERFRPVVDWPTNIEVFKKLLAGVPPKEPQQLRLPLR